MTASVRRSTARRAAAVPLLLALVVLSGCGKDVDKGPKPTLAGSDTIVTTGTTLYGLVLTDGTGRTLYQFDGDRNGKQACTDACSNTWQPYVAQGEPQVRPANTNAVDENDIALVPMSSTGQMQVSYKGHPLYFYSGDRKPGDITGAGKNDFGGRWTATSTMGDPVYP